MRIALGVEYNGQDFFGWQAQANLLTVQSCVETALAKIADHPVKIFCAGRTDAGVHAIGQVVHFDTEAVRVLRAWVFGTNTHLPSTVAIRWAQEVDNEFHARFSALSRCYRYVIYNHPIRSAISGTRATWYQHWLNIEKMQQAARALIGEQDFSSFRSAQCESKTPMRNVHHVKITRYGDYVVIEIQANAFLHHMVRNIVGVLVKIGAGFKPAEWLQEVLAAKDRRQAAETAPATGLYLYEVQYPSHHQFPISQGGWIFS